jgi:hypothetical protein
MPISLPSCYSIANSLDLDQPFRPAERRDGDLGGGRRLLPEELLSDRDQLLAVPDVGEDGGDLHDVGQRPSARLDLGLGLEGAENRPRLRRKVPPVGGATGVVVGHLAGDEQDRLRPGHLRHLRVRGRAVLARRGVTLDLDHVVSPVPDVSSAQPNHRRTSSECSP